MVDDAKKERRATDKAAKQKAEEQAVLNQERVAQGLPPIGVQEDHKETETRQRDEAQNALVKKLEADLQAPPPSKSRKDGKRRTKCVIAEVSAEAPKERRSRLVITEVAQLLDDSQTTGDPAAAPKGSRRAKSRADREARLKAAMASVEGVKTEGAEPQFHQLSDQEVVDKLTSESETTGKQGKKGRSKLVIEQVGAVDEDAELIVESPSQRKSSPVSDVPLSKVAWGTKRDATVLDKAAMMEPTLEDEEVAVVVADDMTAILDVEELD